MSDRGSLFIVVPLALVLGVPGTLKALSSYWSSAPGLAVFGVLEVCAAICVLALRPAHWLLGLAAASLGAFGVYLNLSTVKWSGCSCVGPSRSLSREQHLALALVLLVTGCLYMLLSARSKVETSNAGA